MKRDVEDMIVGVYYEVLVRITFNMPITQQDVAHVEQNPRYMACEIPQIRNVRVTRIPGNSRNVRIEWNVRNGCVSAITMNELEVHVRAWFPKYHITTVRTQGIHHDATRGVFFSTLPIVRFWRGMEVLSIKARPNSLVRGSAFYPKQFGLVPNRITLR